MTFIQPEEEIASNEQQPIQKFRTAKFEPECHEESPIDWSERRKAVAKKPYLKRRSIRVDLALRAIQERKQERIFNQAETSVPLLEKSCERIEISQKTTNHPCCSNRSQCTSTDQQKVIETLQREKKQVESELLLLQGKYMQLEQMYYEMRSFYTSGQKPSIPVQAAQKPQQTQPPQGWSCKKTICCKPTVVHNREVKQKKKSPKSSTLIVKKKPAESIEECQKCHKHFQFKYMKYHERVCGNTKLKNLLNERDLIQLEKAKLNLEPYLSKYEFDWRKRRNEFQRQVEQAKLRKSFIVLCKRK